MGKDKGGKGGKAAANGVEKWAESRGKATEPVCKPFVPAGKGKGGKPGRFYSFLPFFRSYSIQLQHMDK